MKNANNFCVYQFYTEFALASISFLPVESEIGSLNMANFFGYKVSQKKYRYLRKRQLFFLSLQSTADKLTAQERRGHFLVWDSTIK